MKVLASASLLMLLLVIFLTPSGAIAQLSTFCTIPSVTACAASSIEYCISESQAEVCLYLYLNGQPPYSNLPSPSSPGGGASAPTGTPARPVPTVARQKRAIACANAYGKYSSQPGFTITFVPQYGWLDESRGIYQGTSTDRPPDTTHAWIPVDGNTSGVGFVTGATTIYVNGYNSFQNTIETLEHEFAHQNGHFSEALAEQAAVDAGAAWKKDGGALCAPNDGGTNSVDPIES